MGPSVDESLELIRQLRMLNQIQNAVRMRFWDDEFGLHPAAGALLADVVARGECRVSDLAEQRVVDTSVVSRQIAQLEKVGLVDRRPSPSDGRVALISPTERGVEVLAGWKRKQADLIIGALGGWDDDRLAATNHVLRDLVAALRATLEA
ncbi:MarR family winged helix-turn-helix transcriptional regulator [Kutzneria buriramensis]|uniref:DNA-binding MarR family transcriptional regulator n=1 Tax=Kutzneria buriramensis TaxID=1045776 RepID=A0A3E0I8T7_9PSEU|nr:MarR family winged helix-turn-helix transcriptional regulator [Kutzneria buriramensis]REH55011.1 DNA-binding MarR family transcriptional regulator [Kutzneria buriramensis]